MKRFTVKNTKFYLDGEEFYIHSGAIHYFRIPKIYWEDRLLKLKECGFNCVETYVPWNLHEKVEGEFSFIDMLDLSAFISLAKNLGLYAIVRPGPFICAEWEFGGFPAWLLNKKGIQFRCNNKVYLKCLYSYLDKVLNIVKPHLIENGGNVLMLQIENEYGDFGNDVKYLKNLKKLYEKIVPEAIYFTSDGVHDKHALVTCALKDCMAFPNFGSDAEIKFEKVKQSRKNQPLMCAEFWSGWFDHWHGKHTVRSSDDITKGLLPFFENNYNFNMYMFCGGTNFGFYNGAILPVDGFQPTITSYDYSAPLTESGDRTETYYKIRDMFKKYYGIENDLTATDSKKQAYGKIKFIQKAKLFDNLKNIGYPKKSATPLSMEELGQNYGYSYYVADKFKLYDNLPLSVNGLKDRAVVFANGQNIGYFERDFKIEKLDIPENLLNKSVQFSLLVENMGRLNYGKDMFEHKGFTSVDIKNRVIFGWTCYKLDIENIDKLAFEDVLEKTDNVPTYYKGVFNVLEVNDTFIYPKGFNKGFILINGFNIGRFYISAGPQKTLYAPKNLLKCGENEVVIFNSDGDVSLDAEFIDAPILE